MATSTELVDAASCAPISSESASAVQACRLVRLRRPLGDLTDGVRIGSDLGLHKRAHAAAAIAAALLTLVETTMKRRVRREVSTSIGCIF